MDGGIAPSLGSSPRKSHGPEETGRRSELSPGSDAKIIKELPVGTTAPAAQEGEGGRVVGLREGGRSARCSLAGRSRDKPQRRPPDPHPRELEASS